MPLPKYKYDPAKVPQVGIVRETSDRVTTSDSDGVDFYIDENEIEFAKLFDGERSTEGVLDLFFKERSIRFSKTDRDKLLSKLCKSQLLAKLEPANSLPEKPDNPFPDQFDQSHFSHFLAQKKTSKDNYDVGVNGMSEVDGTDDNTHPAVADEAQKTTRVDHVKVEQQSPEQLDVSAEAKELGEQENFNSEQRDRRWARTLEHIKKIHTERKIRGPKIIIEFPVRRVLPLGNLLIVPQRSRILMILLLLCVVIISFEFWFSRVEATRDFYRVIKPLNIFQTVIFSMLTVNFLGQLARAAMLKKLCGSIPRFGIIFAFRIWPRFHTDISLIRSLRTPQEFRLLAYSTLFTVILVYIVSSLSWFITKGSATSIPLISIGIASLSFLVLLSLINPLSNRDGYLLLVTWLRVPDLRARALQTLFGLKSKRQFGKLQGAKKIPNSILRLYGVFVLAYIFTISYFLFTIVGRWLENSWGGFGVVALLILVLIITVEPFSKIKSAISDSNKQPGSSRLTTSPHSILDAQANTRPPSKFLSSLPWIVGLIVVIVIGCLPYVYEPGGDFVLRPFARQDVRPLISGQIKDVYVSEGDQVEANQLLARLTSDEEEMNIAVTEANLQELESRLNMAVQGATQETIDLAKQKVRTASTKYTYSKNRATRQEQLIREKAISLQEYENALSQAETDLERLREAKQELVLLLAGVRTEEVNIIRAEIRRFNEKLLFYKQQLSYAEIRSGIKGQIIADSILYSAGDYLKTGELFAAVENIDKLYAHIRIPETEIGEVKLGSKVRLKSWAFPTKEIFGEVTNIAPNAETTEYGKVVRVTTEIPNEKRLLQSEMTGYGKIEGEHTIVALAFSRIFIRFFLIEIWSWLP